MKYVITLVTLLLCFTQIDAQIITISELTPGSDFLDVSGQELVFDALPAEFRYEAELVYQTSTGGLTATSFHNACDGLSNTLVVGRTSDGHIFGGYNEGVWSSDGNSQTDLTSNFVFSVTRGEVYTAIEGETHITNSSIAGPYFGRSGNAAMRFFSDAGSVVKVISDLGITYTCPTTNDCVCLLNDGTCASGFTDRFNATDYEVWQLKSSGNKAFAVGIDYNEDGIVDTSTDCYEQTEQVFPASQILTERQDALLASWLPEEFLYEADPLFASNNATVGRQNFLNNVAGFTNTMIIIRTGDGQIIGGYNEGFWTASNFEQGDLDNNFLFNLAGKRQHMAIPGEVHITTGGTMNFGGSDLKLDFDQDEHYSEFISYFPTSTTESDFQTYPYLTAEDAFSIDRIEVWKLNTSGESIFLPVDEDNNGICDHLDINNFITSSAGCVGDLNNDDAVTVSDLSMFLAVFGSNCN